MLGEAEKPGLFYLTGPTTLLEMLSKAGGLARSAGKDLVLVRTEGGKAGGRRRRAQHRAAPLRPPQDPGGRRQGERAASQNGDMMFVPKASAFFVLGEVNKRGHLPARQGDRRAGGGHPGRGLQQHGGAVGGQGAAAHRRGQAGDDLDRPLGRRPAGQELPAGGRRHRHGAQGQHLLRLRGGAASRAPISSTRRRTCWRASPSRAGSPTRPRPAARGSSAPGRQGQQTIAVDMNDVIRRGQREKAIRLLENDVIVVPESFFEAAPGRSRTSSRVSADGRATPCEELGLPGCCASTGGWWPACSSSPSSRVAIWALCRRRSTRPRATVLIEPEPPRILNIQEVTPMGRARPGVLPHPVRADHEPAGRREGHRDAQPRARMPEIGSARPTPSRRCRRHHRRAQAQHPAGRGEASSTRPPSAAEVTNALARQYVKHNLDIKLRGAQEAMTWLNEQMTQAARGKVQESSVGAAELSRQGRHHGAAGAAADHRRRRSWTSTSVPGVPGPAAVGRGQAERAAAGRPDQGGAQTIFTVADSQLIQKLKREASELEVTKAKLSKTYKDKHPEILKIDAQIEQVSQRIDAEIKKMMRAVQTEFGGPGPRGDAARQRQPAARRGPGAQREGDPVPRPAARRRLEPAALRGRAQAPQGDRRHRRARDQQRERGRGRDPAPDADPPAQGVTLLVSVLLGLLARGRDRADDRVLRHDGEDARRRRALPGAAGHRHRAGVLRKR